MPSSPTRRGASVVDTVFDELERGALLALLAQDGVATEPALAVIEARARARSDVDTVWHLTAPSAAEGDVDHYFARLGRRCGLEEVAGAASFESALDDRLGGGERIFLLVSRFAKSAAAGRARLGQMLRSLAETHNRHGERRLRVVFCGGEELARLKFELGEHSVLSSARLAWWPELSVADVLEQQQREASGLALGEERAASVLALCGGDPRLLRFWLEQEMLPEARRERLEDCAEVVQVFTRLAMDDRARRRVCEVLGGEDVGVWGPWILEPVARRLFWGNLVRREGRQLVWRGDVVRRIGGEVLGC